MAKVIVLGSSYAIADDTHENTHLALVGQNGLVMIDCAGQPVLRLKRAGLAFEHVGDLILTHFHPDHVYGVPLFIMDMWLRGRRRPLRIHGLRHCVERTEALMNAYEWRQWPDLYPVSFHAVEPVEDTLLLDSEDFRITAWPVVHFLPTVGLRVLDKKTGRVVAYSCDTEPGPHVERLAAGADVLIHEATGAGPGHTSAAQAGQLARAAAAKRLVLIHYPTGGADLSHLAPQAQATFGGPVALAEDFMVVDL